MNCPMCNIELSTHRTCPKCGREWLSQTIAGEEVLTSKPRIVELISEPEAGKLLDDCIRPIIPHTFTFSNRAVEGIDDTEATFISPGKLHELCPPLKGIKSHHLQHLMAMKIILDDPCTITIKRDDFEGDI